MNWVMNMSANNHAKITFEELKKRQSVRTTFKLPQEVIDLLGVMAGQLGIKQKSILDQLTEDTSVLHKLAREANPAPDEADNRRSKTFVISRSALQSINNVARIEKIPRDIVVEVSIKRLLPIIAAEREKHNSRKALVKEMKEHMKIGDALFQKAKKLLGNNDEICSMLEDQVNLAKKNIATADALIAKGTPMENL